MENKNVLVVCGGGASSGFLVQSIKKAAKKRGVSINIKARSESEIGDYINSIDLLLFGPHLKYMEEDIVDIGRTHNVPISIIDQAIYGTLNGEKALELILDLLKE